MKNQKHYNLLIKRYLNGQISKKELEAFVHLMKEGTLDEHLQASMDVELQKQFVKSHTPFYRKRFFPWVIWAALIALVVSIFIAQNSSPAIPKSITTADIKPGSNKAVLTLANGKQIALDSQQNSQLAHVDDIDKQQSKAGTLVYNKEQQAENSALMYNMITIPEGGQYHIVLPDGSGVWLNASSTLKYPTAFSNTARVVELSGEGYFEVTPDANRPFLVKTNHQDVKVLGTTFNIMAYPGEAFTKTSLLAGKVEVRDEIQESIVLTPGKQVVFSNDTKASTTLAFDSEEVIAWKNGNFLFNETPLIDILRNIARWYAVKIDPNHIPDIRYNGFISRNVTLSKVLQMMEKTGDVKFDFENNTIKITNQIQ